MFIACRLATLKTYILTRLKLVYSIVVVGMKMNDGLEGNARSGQPMLDTRSCSVQCFRHEVGKKVTNTHIHKRLTS